MTTRAVVVWGGQHRVEVAGLPEFDEALSRAELEARACGVSQAVEITTPRDAGTLAVVVGSDRGFVHHVPADGNPPYISSVGEEDDDRAFVFYAHGDHHTEASWRNTVTRERALEAARYFFETDRLDPRLCWEEV